MTTPAIARETAEASATGAALVFRAARLARMNLADFSTGAVRLQPCESAPHIDLLPSRGELEQIALACARRERNLHELTHCIAQQQTSLAELRGLLLQILWPRRESAR